MSQLLWDPWVAGAPMGFFGWAGLVLVLVVAVVSLLGFGFFVFFI